MKLSDIVTTLEVSQVEVQRTLWYGDIPAQATVLEAWPSATLISTPNIVGAAIVDTDSGNVELSGKWCNFARRQNGYPDGSLTYKVPATATMLLSVKKEYSKLFFEAFRASEDWVVETIRVQDQDITVKVSKAFDTSTDILLATVVGTTQSLLGQQVKAGLVPWEYTSFTYRYD